MARHSRKKSTAKNYSESPVVRTLIFLVCILLLTIVWLNRRSYASLSEYGILGIFLINFLASSTVIVPLPGVAAVFLGGAVYSPFMVGIISGLGAAVGELLGYLTGYGGRGLLPALEKENHWLKNIEKYFHKTGFITVAVFSAIPIPIFDFIGILAGTLNYPIWKFTLATLLGRTVRNIIIAWTGAVILPY